MRKTLILFLLSMLSVASSFGQWTPPSAPKMDDRGMVDDGETVQYIYNVGAKGFFTGANDWGTRASVSTTQGAMVKMTKEGDGVWSIIDYVAVQKVFKKTFALDAESIWVDNDNGDNCDSWVVTALSDGTYTIHNAGIGEYNLGVAEYYYGETGNTRLWLKDTTLVDNAGYPVFAGEFWDKWYFVSPEDYQTWYDYNSAYTAATALSDLLETVPSGMDSNKWRELYKSSYEYSDMQLAASVLTDAVEELSDAIHEYESQQILNGDFYEGKDITGMLVNPSFEDGLTGWLLSQKEVSGGLVGRKNVEVYDGKVSIRQTIHNLPKGIYAVTFNGFERAAQNGEYYGDERSITNCFINNVQHPLLSIGSDAISAEEAVDKENCYVGDGSSEFPHDYMINGVGYVPNSMDGASYAFGAGRYLQTVYGFVGDDGELTLGFTSNGNHVHWTIFDDIHLTYYGQNSEIAHELARQLEFQADNIDGDMSVPAREQLKTAIEKVYQSIESESMFESMIELSDEIQHAKDNVVVLRNMKAALDQLRFDVGEFRESVSDETITKIEEFCDVCEELGQVSTTEEIEGRMHEIYVYQSLLRIPNSYTEATKDNPVDFTQVIINPDFEANTTLQSPKGWTLSLYPNSMGNYQTQDGFSNISMEFWSELAITNKGELYQQLASLPEGDYKLLVDASNSYNDVEPGEGTGYACVFASTGEKNSSDTKFSVIATQSEGCREKFDTYEVDFTVSNGQDVFVGVKTEGDLSARWLMFDNFRLLYYGNDGVDTPDDTTHVDPLPEEKLLASGTYYIMNTETGMFVNSGNDWDTHAVLRSYGLDFVVSHEDGGYTINSNISNANQNKYLTHGCYLDSPYELLDIKPVGNGEYQIISYAEEGNPLYMTSSDRDEYADVWFLSADDIHEHVTHWKFLSEAEMKAILESATATAPVNATYLLPGARFTRNDIRLSNWKGLPNLSDANMDNNAEKYGTKFNVYQNISVPNGFYRLSMYGFIRNRSIEYGSDNYPLGNEVHSYFYANDRSVALPLVQNQSPLIERGNGVYDYHEALGYVPTNQQAAADAFGQGLYRSFLDVEVKDGKLTVGVKNEQADSSDDWTVFDNFDIMYYGTQAGPTDSAVAFEQDGFRYEIVSDVKKYVKVIGCETASANFEIPKTVLHNDNTYTVVQIADSAFCDQKAVDVVTIPKTIVTIGDKAFDGCTISEIYDYNKTPQFIREGTFSNYSATLHVPAGSLNTYNSAWYWKNFNNVLEDLYLEEWELIPDENGIVHAFSPDGSLADRMQSHANEVKVLFLHDAVTDEDIEYVRTLPNLLNLYWQSEQEMPYRITDGKNPNLLTFVSQSTKINYEGERAKNIVIGTDEGPYSNRIVFVDNYPIRIPEEIDYAVATYTKNFSKTTVPEVASGWETLSIPFNCDTFTSEDGRDLQPFGSQTDSEYHFWLYSSYKSASLAFTRETSIRANKCYIISMPNSPEYVEKYNISGNVTFSSHDDYLHITTYGLDGTGQINIMYPNYEQRGINYAEYTLNDSVFTDDNTGMTYYPGSVFLREARDVRPFEPYVKSLMYEAPPVLRFTDFNIADDIKTIDKEHNADGNIYTLDGRLIRLSDDVREGVKLPSGIYLRSGKKVIVR